MTKEDLLIELKEVRENLISLDNELTDLCKDHIKESYESKDFVTAITEAYDFFGDHAHFRETSNIPMILNMAQLQHDKRDNLESLEFPEFDLPFTIPVIKNIKHTSFFNKF